MVRLSIHTLSVYIKQSLLLNRLKFTENSWKVSLASWEGDLNMMGSCVILLWLTNDNNVQRLLIIFELINSESSRTKVSFLNSMELIISITELTVDWYVSMWSTLPSTQCHLLFATTIQHLTFYPLAMCLQSESLNTWWRYEKSIIPIWGITTWGIMLLIVQRSYIRRILSLRNCFVQLPSNILIWMKIYKNDCLMKNLSDSLMMKKSRKKLN